MQGTTEEAKKQAAIENITEYYSFVLNGVSMTSGQQELHRKDFRAREVRTIITIACW